MTGRDPKMSVEAAAPRHARRRSRSAEGWLGWFGRSRSRRRSAAGDGLDRTLADLNSRQEDLAFLSDVGQLFQACRTIEEVCNVAKDRLQSLSPHLSGALFLMSEGRDYLEGVMAWGAIEASAASLAPSDCWALRCGRPHQLSRGHEGIACAHTDAAGGDWHLCVPLMAQGEALGVLYFRVDAGHDPSGDHVERRHFYFNVAETLSLALANIRLRETLQHQAIRDPLTGLFNRRYFQETLRRELHRASRAKQPLSVVLLDIDHFKRFNDTYGHATGDKVLKLVARTLKQSAKGRDTAARYGGEEFGVVLPGTVMRDALAFAEQVRRRLAGKELKTLDGSSSFGSVTMSLGVSQYRAGEPVTHLLQRADAALYASKRDGRNRVTAEAADDLPEAAAS